MNNLDPLQKLQMLTVELETLSSDIQNSKYQGRAYEVIYGKLGEHDKAICKIFLENITHLSDLLNPIDNYATRIKTLSGICRQLPDSEKKNHLDILSVVARMSSIKFQLKDAKTQPNMILMNKISLVFGLDINSIQAMIKYTEDFFQEAANVCFELAAKRLKMGTPLDFKEVKDIHNLLSETFIIPHISSKASTDCTNPHPTYVFKNLYAFFISIEKFASWDQIKENTESHLNDESFAGPKALLNMSKADQESGLRGLKEGAESNPIYQSILDAFERYKIALRKLPVVDVKTALPGSNNINQTFFLNVEDHSWVFKPIEGNAGGIVKAECMASIINQDHEFPIPLTIRLKIKDCEGSAQMYVKEASTLAEIEIEETFIDTVSFQKLVVFDLLFANSDRNSAKFIFNRL